MGAVRAWAAIDVRRRWRTLVVLVLLVGLSAGTVMTTVAGARRGDSSLDRLLDRTRPATAVVQPNFGTVDYDAIARLPYVEALSRFVLAFTPAIRGVSWRTMDNPRLDDAMMTDLERPVVLEGRGYRPSATDEAVVTERFRDRYGLGVGDEVRLHLSTSEQVDRAFNQELPVGRLDGAVVPVTIVGVVRTPALDLPDDEGRISFSPGLARAHLADLTGTHGFAPVAALVRLRGGASDLPRLREDIAAISGRADVEVTDLGVAYQRADEGLRFEAAWLAGFGAAVLLAAAVLVGQAIARSATVTARELEVGRALGMTAGQTRLAAASLPALAGLVGAALAVLLAVAASEWFPIGRAADLEPAPGTDVDVLVLVPGFVLCVLAVAGVAYGAAVLAGRPDRPLTRPSLLHSAEARLGLPVPVVVGARFAFERGRGRNALPVWPTYIAAAVGVLGTVAVGCVAAGVADATAHPERFGQSYQLVGFVGGEGTDVGPVDRLVARLAARDDVTSLHRMWAGVVTRAGGSGSFALWGPAPGGGGPVPATVLSGRMPESPGEVTLTPGTQDALDVGLGETVRVVGDRGERSLRVVGTAFVPTGAGNEYNEGGWLTTRGFGRLFDAFTFDMLFASVTPAADDAGLADRIDAYLEADPRTAVFAGAVGTPATEDFDASAATDELDRVRTLPLALGAFLGVLGTAAVGHALVLAVRRRARDVAVLRAVGMTPAGARVIVLVQALALAAVGLVPGIPLGIAAGRSIWRVVADYVPLAYVDPAAWAFTGALVVVALVVAVLLAQLPARRAARTSIATTLAAE